ncbi:hypothetical protein [Desulfopila inferna]|uniref:hypothetical protein n=1 Tax=Desulfopila inferna TaxID=468528 RepID=UPI00196463B2|nr:hypothetical protein [Desulfopila inferna]MBM9606745.1 hypothetical protein [Desulfopila inferna]
MSMDTKGIKLVEHDKLESQIFLPKPTLFMVTKEQTIEGDLEAYTIPVQQYYNHKNVCYDWWGGVFSLAEKYKIKIEVRLVTNNLCSGFIFHEPESSFVPTYRTNPNDEFYRLRKEALAKKKDILEIQQNLRVLRHVIAGVTPLTPEFESHLLRFVGDEYSAMEFQCFCENPAVSFPVNDYLVKYGLLKGLHPWDLADAGLLSNDSADSYSRELSRIDFEEMVDKENS